MLERYEKMIHQGELPRLKIVSASSILFHEEIEPARLRRVAARLEEDGILRHPPVVATIPGTKKLLLIDGAHRVSALRELSIRNILVQIVPYGDRLVELHRWSHVLDLEDPKRLISFVRSMPGIAIEEHRPKQPPLCYSGHHAAYAQIILAGGKSLLLEPKDGRARASARWIAGAADTLRPLCSMYKQHGFRDRISYDEFQWIETNYPEYSAVVVFPQFTKQEITRVARSRQKLPAGVTRHLIPKRALRFNMPLWLLIRKLPLRELNRRLVEMILNRSTDARIRFYSESTFSFDE